MGLRPTHDELFPKPPPEFPPPAGVTQYEVGGFVVWAKHDPPEEDGRVVCVDFDVWWKNSIGRYGPDPDHLFITGHVKWDGCSNWEPPQKHMPWHFCRVEQAESVGALFRAMYEIAGKLMPYIDFAEDLHGTQTTENTR